jgi:hypothetical protein
MDRVRARAVTLIQGAVRKMIARRILRQKAYAYFKKHWDITYLEYYYEDKRSRRTFWKKPFSLGSYDGENAFSFVIIINSNSLFP